MVNSVNSLQFGGEAVARTTNGAPPPSQTINGQFSTALQRSLQDLGFSPGQIQVAVQDASSQSVGASAGQRQFLVTFSSAPAAASSTAASTAAAVSQDAPVDYVIDVIGWDREKTMAARRMYGYTWVPSASMPNIECAPGVFVPGLRPYDPNNPPAGAIIVPPDPATPPPAALHSASTSNPPAHSSAGGNPPAHSSAGGNPPAHSAAAAANLAESLRMQTDLMAVEMQRQLMDRG